MADNQMTGAEERLQIVAEIMTNRLVNMQILQSELLAACEGVVEWVENGEFEDRNYEGEVGDVMRPLRAAIAKANATETPK